MRTDLHGILDIFQRAVDRYVEFAACFFGKSLELRPREPVWNVPHYRGVSQVLVGYRLGACTRTDRNDISEEFPRYQHDRYCM